MVTLHPQKETATVAGRHNPPEVSVTSRGIPSPSKVHLTEGTCGRRHPKQDYSAGLNLAPAQLSFNRGPTVTDRKQLPHDYYQEAFLLRSQAGPSHSHTFRTGSLQRSSSPGTRAIKQRSFGYSAQPISSSLRCLRAWLNEFGQLTRGLERAIKALAVLLSSALFAERLLSGSCPYPGALTASKPLAPPQPVAHVLVLPEGLLQTDSPARGARSAGTECHSPPGPAAPLRPAPGLGPTSPSPAPPAGPHPSAPDGRN